MARIDVITACTGEKAATSPEQLTLADFGRGGAHVERREAELGPLRRPAEEMYTGQQHVRLMAGVHRARARGHDVRVHVASAGYGLVSGTRMIAPYDATFIGMGRAEAAAWATRIGIARDVSEVLTSPSDLCLILLGEAYLSAAGIDRDFALTDDRPGPVWALVGARSGRLADARPPLYRVGLSTADTGVFGAGMVALKGAIAARMIDWALPALERGERLTAPPALGLIADESGPVSAPTTRAGNMSRRP